MNETPSKMHMSDMGVIATSFRDHGVRNIPDLIWLISNKFIFINCLSYLVC